MAEKKGSKTKKKANSKSTSKKRQTVAREESVLKNSVFVHGVVWSLLFVFSALFMYLGSDALLAKAVRDCLGGLFGITSYTVPVIFGGTLIYLVYYRNVGRMWYKFILSVAAMTEISALIGLFARYDASAAYDICSAYINGGGLVGVVIAQTMSSVITSVGTFLVLFILFVVTGSLIANVNLIPYISNALKRLCGFSVEMGEKVRQKNDEYRARRQQLIEEAEQPDIVDYDDEPTESAQKRFTPPEDFMPDDELPESLSERTKKRGASSVPKTAPARTIGIANDFACDLEDDKASPKPDLFEKEFEKEEKFDLYHMDFSSDEEENHEDNKDVDGLGNDKKVISADNDKGIIDEQEPDESTSEDLFKDIKVNEMKDSKPKEKKLTDSEKSSFHRELDDAMLSEVEEYKFPTLALLDESKHVSNDKRRELYSKAEQLIAVLDNFGVKAKPVQVTQGPTVTRYEIQPSSGTKLSKIVGLADDIALNLAVSTVLIAPVPGKAATVGVEIPNNNVTPVTIREMLASAEFRNAKSKLTVCLGKDIGGNVVVGDIAKWPHALIAGATGSGKSVCINTIITSILYKADPSEVKLIMVDPKQVELGVYNGIPHLLIPVVTEAKKAAGALNWAVSEMMHRYDLFKNSGVRKLEMYNKLMEKIGGEKLPQIVIIIDELADLMMVAAKEVEDYICRLAQLARAAGIHLIIATQRPSVDVITGLIKANIPSRIAFFVSSQVDSRTILDKAGAEKLLGMGDMLYYPTGARSTTRVQGAFVSDGEVERIIDYIKESSPQTHYSEDLEEHIERISLGENGVTPDKEEDGDALLPEAIKLAVELGKISTSMIQRRLGVGYSRAGRIIDQMEERGIVSPANGAKPRDVLVSHADMVFNTPDDETED